MENMSDILCRLEELAVGEEREINPIIGIKIGETFENKNIRAKRWSSKLEVTDLENAGKRGKMVDVASLYNIDYKMSTISADRVEKILKEIKSMTFDQFVKAGKVAVGLSYAPKFEVDKVRGVDVAPPGVGTIKITGKGMSLVSSFKSFSVKDTSDPNEETIIDPMRASKTHASKMYKMVQELGIKLNSMDFDQVRKEMDRRKINYHQYYALD